jgi:hypothetical protein
MGELVHREFRCRRHRDVSLDLGAAKPGQDAVTGSRQWGTSSARENRISATGQINVLAAWQWGIASARQLGGWQVGARALAAGDAQ